MSGLGQRLYRGEVSYDFISKWKTWLGWDPNWAASDCPTGYGTNPSFQQ